MEGGEPVLQPGEQSESPSCSPEATGLHGSYTLGRLTSLRAQPSESAR